MEGGQTQYAQIQNIVFNKTDKLIPRYTIRQITKYKKRMIVNDYYFSEMLGENENLSSSELHLHIPFFVVLFLSNCYDHFILQIFFSPEQSEIAELFESLFFS